MLTSKYYIRVILLVIHATALVDERCLENNHYCHSNVKTIHRFTDTKFGKSVSDRRACNKYYDTNFNISNTGGVVRSNCCCELNHSLDCATNIVSAMNGLIDHRFDCYNFSGKCDHKNSIREHYKKNKNADQFDSDSEEIGVSKVELRTKSRKCFATDGYYYYFDDCKRGLEHVMNVLNTIVIMFAIIIAAYLFCVFNHPLIVTL